MAKNNLRLMYFISIWLMMTKEKLSSLSFKLLVITGNGDTQKRIKNGRDSLLKSR